MAPNPRVVQAYRAMANLGIHESKVKPVLKKLLKLYDKNWELIEEESYRALADAIFEEDENKGSEADQENTSKKDDEEAHMHDEPVRPLKRLRLRGQDGHSSRPLTSCGPSTAALPLKTPKLEDDTVPESSFGLQPQSTTALSDGNARIEAGQVPLRDATVDKGKKPVSPQVTQRGRWSISDGTHRLEPVKEPTIEPGASLLSKNKVSHQFTLLKPKDEPIDDMPDYLIPIAVIPPEPSSGRDSLMRGAAGKQHGHDTVALQSRDVDVEGEDILPSSNEEAISNVDLGLSSMGEDGSVEIMQSVDDVSKESEANDSLIARGNKDLVMPSCIANGSINVKSSSAIDAPQGQNSLPCLGGLDDAVLVSKKVGVNDLLESGGQKELEDPISPNSRTSDVFPNHQLTTDDIRAVHDVNDLTKGEERVKVSWVNNTTNDFSPPPFHYMPRNLVFRDACVNISLSCIGNGDCCSYCMGNCVLSSKPCSCTNKTGGQFAYTAQGLLKKEFLEECIAISRDSQNYFYCKECPFERSKNDDCLEPCKGHLKRRFIKECWSKCGCGKHCGNRVVQCGMTYNLQVFLTLDGKGWGLRTLEDLPKGAFVCEFIGEILTVKELRERNLKYPQNGSYTYPILLDAEWDSGVVKDREALCLYAASYGNVARFINHRCLDANLIEIPVEIEVPAHHYYHFAFFTSRKIAAQEELTWDYGINFDDHDQPVELFHCRCGSKFCRDIKRSNSKFSRPFMSKVHKV
ncbi:probable inactive histone-lysine N-methyltransferase SUVR2 isoform X1 [Abrus precatorius]|uniref:Probable inactive histone-lysine N-methyltransferase SUVR2 isoform X1 n=1 Tax=Abrus precatorius TaxID=3816 RepID=A0A8B8L6Q7_ABRPR|nr:probable inactive histone-lysine N-methyltransferase SUVR2 isoform X1 [Abrus precatorius]XP_027351893.1 probable inactive histone-lysine N-methyltransferase SUVR2 isoform X1 [Abrus precatorius]XP_027351895.1 probable inactive histone-lysine N-methyltransferase SUVR2 isoform X1 [Abrus precatorius]